VPFHLVGSVYRDNQSSKMIEVISDWSTYEDVFETIAVQPPKMIVGISITVSEEQSFPRGVWTVPAVIDTGFNGGLAINELTLGKWAGVKKEYLTVAPRQKLDDGREFDPCYGNVWLHKSAYKSPSSKHYESPLLLEKLGAIHVMVSKDDEPCWPRLPVLGLRALLNQNLQLRMDPRQGSFVISAKRTIFVSF
jgi:hypothetical protein